MKRAIPPSPSENLVIARRKKKGIERIFPLYPLSRDGAKYNRLMKILALYRLSLGQARQEDLLDHLLSNGVKEEQLNELFMNLSPFAKEKLAADLFSSKLWLNLSTT